MADKNRELRWCEDVMEVYAALGSLPDSRVLSTTSAKYMLRHVENSGDIDKFVSVTVPKAAEMLAKHRPANLAEEAIDIDRKTIVDLKRRLEDTLAQAVGVCSGPSLDDLLS